MRRVLALAVAFLAVGAIPASAATITAFEEIGDSTCPLTSPFTLCADSTRDLYRIRQIGAGPGSTENTDATIVTENSVAASFGVFNDTDFSYTHVLTWLPTATFTDASLMLWAYDVNGNNDSILVGIVSLGTLVMGNNTVTTTSFGTIQSYIVAGLLTVTVNKSNQDSINLFRSRLTVQYDDVSSQQPVPEPATLLLLGSGLAVGAARVRRRRRDS